MILNSTFDCSNLRFGFGRFAIVGYPSIGRLNDARKKKWFAPELCQHWSSKLTNSCKLRPFRIESFELEEYIAIYDRIRLEVF